METQTELSYHKWSIPNFLGLDTALFALFWGQCYVVLLDIPVVTEEPYLFLAVSVSLTYMVSRMFRSAYSPRTYYSSFYVNQMGLLVVLILGVLMALFWITFYYVSLHFLRFIALPAFFLLISGIPFIKRLQFLSLVARAMALSLGCVVPALYFMVTVSPLDALFYPPVYYLALLIIAFELAKMGWNSSISDQRARFSFWSTVLLLLVLILSLSSANTGHFYERELYYSFVIGCATIEILSRMHRYVRLPVLNSVSWLVFAIAPLLSLLLFHQSN